MRQLFEVPPIPHKANLYELDHALIALESQIATAEGEAADELIDAYLNAGGAVKGKLESYGKLRAEVIARQKGRKEESKRLADLAKSDEATVKRLEDRLKNYIEEKNLPEIQANSFRFSVVGVGGVQKLTLDVEPEKLPAAYRKREIVYSHDDEAIRAAIAAGKKIKFAHLEPRGTRLSVR